MNASKVSAVESATLRNLSVELVPSSNWRERAKKGELAMFYSVTGEVLAGAENVRVTFSVDAVKDNGLVALGLEKPSADGTQYRLLANRGNGHEAKVMSDVDANGRLVPKMVDGQPVYAEAEIITENGTAFPMAYGCKYLVNCDRSKTLRISGAGLRYEATTQGGNPCAHASVEAIEVVDAPRTQALGGAIALTGIAALPTQQAARKQGTPETAALLAL